MINSQPVKQVLVLSIFFICCFCRNTLLVSSVVRVTRMSRSRRQMRRAFSTAVLLVDFIFLYTLNARVIAFDHVSSAQMLRFCAVWLPFCKCVHIHPFLHLSQRSCSKATLFMKRSIRSRVFGAHKKQPSCSKNGVRSFIYNAKQLKAQNTLIKRDTVRFLIPRQPHGTSDVEFVHFARARSFGRPSSVLPCVCAPCDMKIVSLLLPQVLFRSTSDTLMSLMCAFNSLRVYVCCVPSNNNS